jgi:hypothetical protein
MAIIDPTEISMPPEAITNVIPNETTTIGNTCRSKFLSVPGCRKFGVMKVLIKISSTKNVSAPYLLK